MIIDNKFTSMKKAFWWKWNMCYYNILTPKLTIEIKDKLKVTETLKININLIGTIRWELVKCFQEL
jgi:hypothetical protein